MKRMLSCHSASRIFFSLLCIAFLNQENVFGSIGSRGAFGRSRSQLFSNSVPFQSTFRNLSFDSFNRNNQFNDINRLGAGVVNQFNPDNTGRRFDLVTGNSSFFNQGNLLDPRQTTEIAGFSKVRTVGKQLAELDSNGIAQRLFIGRDGELIGGAKPPEARTVQQLKEFYLLNRDKFQGNAKAVVDRFLARQGAISNGQFIVDVDDFALDLDNEDTKLTLAKRFNGNVKAMRREMGTAALNYLLNTLQARFKIKIPPGKVGSDGRVALNLAPFFRGEALALFQQADPSAACTGKIRLNKLVQFAMDPGNYYKFLNAPGTRKEVAQAYGVQDDKTLSSDRTLGNANKILITVDENGVKESGVVPGEQRVLEVQNASNIGTPDGRERSCYRSLDTIDQTAEGEQTRSRNIKSEGINFTHDAEEWLCLGSNGFMQGFLFNGPGLTLQRAPAEIANGGILGPSVRTVASCLDCHANGFIGGGTRGPGGKGGKPYLEHSFDVPDRPTIFRDSLSGRTLRHRDFFTTNGTYKRRALADSQIFKEARVNTGSEFLNQDGEPFKTLPTMIAAFQKAVKPETAAVELGFGDSPGAIAKAKSLIGNFKTRSDFEAQFCQLSKNSTRLPNEEDDQRTLIQNTREHGF